MTKRQVMSLSQQLREELQLLEGVKVPHEHLANDKENDSIQSHFFIVEQYKQARDQYLTRQLRHVLVDSIKTFNGNSFDVPPPPTETDILDAQRQRDQKIGEILEKAKLISKRRAEIQAKYSMVQSLRNQCKEILQELELSDSVETSASTQVDTNNFEEDLEIQNKNLKEMRSRRAELELRLQMIKDENMDVQRSLQVERIQVSKLHAETAPEYDLSRKSLQHVEARNAEAKAHLDKLMETKLMYDRLRGILEELFAVQICSIETSPTSNETMSIVIMVLRKYEIRLSLKKSLVDNRNHEAKVCHIKLLSDPIVKASAMNNEPTVQLTIPDLNDLVEAAECRPLQNDNIAFIVREITARLTIVEKRVEILSDLQQIVITKIGKLNENTEADGPCRGDQEVVCSFNEEQLTVLLRLTPDCPFLKGSVFIDQIVGLGGWDSTVLEEIKITMNNKEFKDPVALVQELREHIKTLQQGGLVIPKTPSLPRKHA